MCRLSRLRAPVFAVAACVLAVGCSPSADSDEQKTSSPRDESGLRPERGFRKKANAPNTPEQDAVFAFLEKDKELFKAATKGVTPDTQPSAFAKMFAEYADALGKADTAALPPAFKSSAAAYQSAAAALPKAFAPLPDNTLEGTGCHDAVRAVFRKDEKKGKPLGGDVLKAVQDLQAAGDKLYQTAGSYGVDADR